MFKILLLVALVCPQVLFARESRIFVKVNLEESTQGFEILGREAHGYQIFNTFKQVSQNIKVNYQIIGERHYAVLNQSQSTVYADVPGRLNKGSSSLKMEVTPNQNVRAIYFDSQHVNLERQTPVELPFGIDIGDDLIERRQSFVGSLNLSEGKLGSGSFSIVGDSQEAESKSLSLFLFSILESKVEQICNDPYVKILYVDCIRSEIRFVSSSGKPSEIFADDIRLSYNIRPHKMEAVVYLNSPL